MNRIVVAKATGNIIVVHMVNVKMLLKGICLESKATPMYYIDPMRTHSFDFSISFGVINAS